MRILAVLLLCSCANLDAFEAYHPVEVPMDQEVCFSPAEYCDSKIIAAINTATVSLDVAIYSLTHGSIADLLVEKAKSIPVRVIADRGQAKGKKALIAYLQKMGVPVKFGKQRGIMHDKFVIIDKRMVETGSFNYSYNAVRNNQENQIYLTAPSVIERYSVHFEEMWATAK